MENNTIRTEIDKIAKIIIKANYHVGRTYYGFGFMDTTSKRKGIRRNVKILEKQFRGYLIGWSALRVRKLATCIWNKENTNEET